MKSEGVELATPTEQTEMIETKVGEEKTKQKDKIPIKTYAQQLAKEWQFAFDNKVKSLANSIMATMKEQAGKGVSQHLFLKNDDVQCDEGVMAILRKNGFFCHLDQSHLVVRLPTSRNQTWI